MPFARPRDVTLHYDYRPGRGRPIVFANSLGTDLRIWDEVRMRIASDAPVLAMDKRGHGLSGGQAEGVGSLAADVADMMDELGLADALVCGVSVGGQIALRLAAERPDLVAGLVLSNTAHRVGDPSLWAERIAAVEAEGMAAIADGVIARWFSADFGKDHATALDGWRTMLLRTPAEGYAAVCAALRDADLTDEAREISCPTLVLGGQEDGATPPDLVKAFADLIPGAACEILEGVGHIPAIEAPGAAAGRIERMLARLSEGRW